MSKLSAYLNGQKRAFIDSKGRAGGTADQFRGHVRQRYLADKLMFDSMMLDALMEATTKKWEQQPRREGADLFRICAATQSASPRSRRVLRLSANCSGRFSRHEHRHRLAGYPQ